jgi:hypothetical protein
VRINGDLIAVNGGLPCRFVRFSGFDPDQPNRATRYSARLAMDNLGDAAELFRRYFALLAAAGYHETKSLPYAYNNFDNGVPIPHIARQIYRELGSDAERFGDPRRTIGSCSFFNWLNEPDGEWTAGLTDHTVAGRLTRLWRTIYKWRSDVREAFPDPAGTNREEFLQWIIWDGAAEYQVSKEFVQADR